jgi:hypothetical protein
MRLTSNIHLAYCTNIHRGEDWAETFNSLQRYTLQVRDRVCPGKPYAIGLRLSDKASRELSEPAALKSFQSWLDKNNCYIFTINGFPYGNFHGTRVKEQVYAPDWTTPERLEYTNRLFDILAQLVPAGYEGSVSTVPGSFKEFITTPEQVKAMRQNLWRCIEHIAKLSEETGKVLHLGLEPEPLCYLETTAETVSFFEQMRADRPKDLRLRQYLGVNYDTCHLAIECEDPEQSIEWLRRHEIKLSKIHLSSALKVIPTPETREALIPFANSTYFHQVIQRNPDGSLTRFKDLDLALNNQQSTINNQLIEWLIHFHIPLHSEPTKLFSNTTDRLLGVLKMLSRHQNICSHLEMETYTWEVMPSKMKNRNVVDQLVDEYEWTLQRLAELGFKPC